MDKKNGSKKKVHSKYQFQKLKVNRADLLQQVQRQRFWFWRILSLRSPWLAAVSHLQRRRHHHQRKPTNTIFQNSIVTFRKSIKSIFEEISFKKFFIFDRERVNVRFFLKWSIRCHTDPNGKVMRLEDTIFYWYDSDTFDTFDNWMENDSLNASKTLALYWILWKETTWGIRRKMR